MSNDRILRTLQQDVEIPESFGTEEQLRQKVSEEDLYKEFTSDENGKNPLPPEEIGRAHV